jgi:HEAT repeats
MISRRPTDVSPFGRIAVAKPRWFTRLLHRPFLGCPVLQGFLVQNCLVMFIVVLFFAGCSRGKSTDGLIDDLSSNDDGDRIKAVRFLQHRRGDAAKVIPALIESLKDSEGDVRWSAAIGLGYFGAEAKSAVPELEKLKSDKDRRIRDAARIAISRIEGKN